jgi:hypothetical protein
MIRTAKIVVTTAGSDGSAEGSGQSTPIVGEVLRFHLDYEDQPATVDVTITESSTGTVLLDKESSNTDANFYPRAGAQTTAGVALTFDATEPVPVPIPVSGHLEMAVEQGDDEATITATVYYRD